MELKRLQIEYFRNFEKIEIELKNHNVIFGMNDVGKTNLMYALRFLLDREVRNNGFTTTDFFRNDISKTIKITLEISLMDYEESMETKNIVSKVGGARNSKNLDTFFFQIQGSYDNNEYFGIPKIFWGSGLDELIELPQKVYF
ncbi:AAA family ATPase [Paenibacillus sp. WLX1005]|uniref:AAA family ATPase n=1 Tax=Paenibacillus sp. WLX1005 TaxID=3243766 RepID=UPI00398424C1